MKGYETAKVKLDHAINQIEEMGFNGSLIDLMYDEVMRDRAQQ